jgi:hypothetical protein
MIALFLSLLTSFSFSLPGALASQAVPAQRNTIVLKLTTPSGRVSTIAVPEGGRATVGQQHGRTLALDPVRGADGRLQVVISAKTSDPETGADAWIVVGRLSLEMRQPARFEDQVFPIGIEWMSYERESLPRIDEKQVIEFGLP